MPRKTLPNHKAQWPRITVQHRGIGLSCLARWKSYNVGPLCWFMNPSNKFVVSTINNNFKLFYKPRNTSYKML